MTLCTASNRMNDALHTVISCPDQALHVCYCLPGTEAVRWATQTWNLLHFAGVGTILICAVLDTNFSTCRH